MILLTSLAHGGLLSEAILLEEGREESVLDLEWHGCSLCAS
jgi:hypothetical protein